MTLKVALCTKFCPFFDKQVIAIALGQLRINLTRIFKVFQIALVCKEIALRELKVLRFAYHFSKLFPYVKTLKILVKLILHPIYAIKYIPGFLKTGLAKIRTHSTTWQ